MVSRGTNCESYPVIGDFVSASQPVPKHGKQAFSVGVFTDKGQLTNGDALTPAGEDYNQGWGVRAKNAFAMARWALTGNHNRDHDGPKYNAAPRIYLAAAHSTKDATQDRVGDLAANLGSGSTDHGFYQSLAR